MKKCCDVLRIAVGITMLALLLAGSANAATITVNANGGGNYSRIQDAIDNAGAGDTILVSSGIYHENVNVTKQLILRGIGNPVVDARRSGSAITLSANGITLEGFMATGSGYYDYTEAGIKVISSNNTLSGNNASNNSYGISLSSSRNNTLSGNNASNNSYGISLSSSRNNTLSGNNASNNGGYGISLSSSRKNTMNRNIMTENQYNFNLDGDIDSDFDNNIDRDNLVDSRPIYYIKKSSNTTYDSSSNAGTFYCISCVNVTIKNLNLNKNSHGIVFRNTTRSRIQNVTASNNYNDGIYLTSSRNNTLIGNNASNNMAGISLSSSRNNTLSRNNASNNWDGISLSSSSNNNTLSRNNISNNGNYYISGISLSSSHNNTLSNNNASNSGDSGISLWYSSNNILSGNNASNSSVSGISLRYSSNNTMTGNNASSNNGNGISVAYSSNNILRGNLVNSNSLNGISLSHSRKNTLDDNNVSNNKGAGIYLSYSSKNTLSDNMMTNFNLNGNTDSDFENYIDISNLVDGRPIYYITKVSDTTYDSSSNAGTFYCISCVNVTIKNLNLNNNGIGIYFWNTTRSRIQNVTAINNNDGIRLWYSSNNTLSKNNASSNNGKGGDYDYDGAGISLSHSSNNTLNGNNASNNRLAGIYLSFSSNNTLSGNNANSNYHKGYYGDDLEYSYKSGSGIYLSSSSNNMLSGNNASHNLKGIYLRPHSNHNKLIGNNASNNVYGIFLRHSSTSNNIYNNIFNNKHNVVFVESNINFWNTTMQSDTNIIGGSFLCGNFWGYPNGTGFSQTCPDVNKDGICDSTYLLDSNNIDYLPLARFTAPGITVVSPNGGETLLRGTTQIIRWNYSGNPGSRVSIELMKNGRKNRVITTNTSNDGAYNWSINSTQTLGADYKIRVKSTTNPSYTDKSDKNFIIADFSVDINKKLILVGVDGFSLANYKSMYLQLKNFSNMVNNGGWNGTLKITGHTKTTTAPGNAELMTGLNESQNGVSSNNGSKIVAGKTIWERLEVYNSSIVTGSVYGKKNSYITTPLFNNAIPHIDWWQDRKTYGARIWPCGTSVDYDVDVANKATEFIEQYNKNSFFLVVYFASPDGSGHYCGGDTGQSYTDSFINVDKSLGILLNSLKDNGIDTTTQIIITGDHGWNLGTTGHGTANNDTRILPLITNNITMLSNATSNGLREQGEVAPTILDFFGMTTSDYQDITNEGYQSMRE